MGEAGCYSWGDETRRRWSKSTEEREAGDVGPSNREAGRCSKRVQEIEALEYNDVLEGLT